MLGHSLGPAPYDDDFIMGAPDNDDDDAWEDDPGFNTFPPGEEGVLQSHAGGEAILQRMLNGIRPG